MKSILVLITMMLMTGCSSLPYSGASLGNRMLPDYYTVNGNIYTYHKLP